MACPFFRPTGCIEDGAWLSPPRLPLGDPCRGFCTAAGNPFEPPPPVLRESCNTGYARGRCGHFPATAPADAVRFSVAADRDDSVVLIFILERDYGPLRHGTLQFEVASGRFLENGEDACLTEQAQYFIRGYLKRKMKV